VKKHVLLAASLSALACSLACGSGGKAACHDPTADSQPSGHKHISAAAGVGARLSPFRGPFQQTSRGNRISCLTATRRRLATVPKRSSLAQPFEGHINCMPLSTRFAALEATMPPLHLRK